MATQEPPNNDSTPFWKHPIVIGAMITAIAGIITTSIIVSCGKSEPPGLATNPTVSQSQSPPPPRPPPAVAAPKHLRVLLAIDLSFSMRTPVREGRETRIQAAARGALEGLEKIKAPYEVGLWTFNDLEPTEPSRIAPYEGSHRLTMMHELTRLRGTAPSGGTPFYKTLQLGIEKLKEEAGDDDRTDPTVNVLLILTDGGDNPSERDRDPVLAKTINELLRQTNDVAVVTTAAYDTSCEHLADVGVPELQNSAHTCHNVRVDVDIDETLQDIVGELVDARKR